MVILKAIYWAGVVLNIYAWGYLFWDVSQETKKRLGKQVKHHFSFKPKDVWTWGKVLFTTFCPIVNIIFGILFIANYDSCIEANIKVIEDKKKEKEKGN